MQLGIYSVYDLKARTYCRPFYSTNDETALRDFSSAVNDSVSDLSRHPSDFSLFKLATFQDVTGLITVEDHPLPLGVGSQFVRYLSDSTDEG